MDKVSFAVVNFISGPLGPENIPTGEMSERSRRKIGVLMGNPCEFYSRTCSSKPSSTVAWCFTLLTELHFQASLPRVFVPPDRFYFFCMCFPVPSSTAPNKYERLKRGDSVY